MKKIIIIGAGVSGLSAGILALKNGFETIIYEKNPLPGGLCAHWKRNGFNIDGCIHWLTGTNEKTYLSTLWKSLGVFKSQDDLIYLNSWANIKYKSIIVPFGIDLESTKQEWLKISPKDKKMINKFFNLVIKFQSLELPLEAKISKLSFKRILRFFKDSFKVGFYYFFSMFCSCSYFSKKFKHEALQYALSHVQEGEGNLYSLLYSYSTITSRNGGIPKGGSKAMIDNIVTNYYSLGGKIIYNEEVDSLIYDKKTVLGIKTKNDLIDYGNYIILSYDINHAIKYLFNNKIKLLKYKKKFLNPKRYPAPSAVLLSFRIKNNHLINPYTFNVSSFNVGGRLIDHINLRSYSYDNYFVIDEFVTYQVLIDQYSENYSYWEKLYKNKEIYIKIKNDIGEHVRQEIIKELNIKNDDIKLLDVATPITFNHYVNALRGEYMGFLFTPKTIPSSIIKCNLKHFYFASQWSKCPGGLPLAAVSGQFAIQEICRKEKIKFNL